MFCIKQKSIYKINRFIVDQLVNALLDIDSAHATLQRALVDHAKVGT